MGETVVDLERTATGEGLLNRMILHSRGSLTTPRTMRIDYLHVDETDTAPAPLLDGYLFGALQRAMALGDPIRVHGRVSRRGLANAMALQELWNCWLPEAFRVVDIHAETVVGDEEILQDAAASGAPGRALAAYSGGVDSTFTLLRHLSDAAPGSLGVTDVVMVHGFDVPLRDRDGFDQLMDRGSRLLEECGVTRHVVRTNLREWPERDWERSYGGQLACVLHQFAGSFDYGVIAAGPHYLRMTPAWGSTALADPLMSGGAFEIVHDGAAFTRIQKVAVIADVATARASLTVCWSGPNAGQNCGVCEKCVRTRLCFAAVGVPSPECFEGPLDPEIIERIEVDNEPQLEDLTRLVRYADRQGIAEPWVEALRLREAQLNAGLGGETAYRPSASQAFIRRARGQFRQVRRRARIAMAGPRATTTGAEGD